MPQVLKQKTFTTEFLRTLDLLLTRNHQSAIDGKDAGDKREIYDS